MDFQNTIGALDHLLYTNFFMLPILGGILGAAFFIFIIVISLKTGIISEFLGDFIVSWNKGVIQSGQFRGRWNALQKDMTAPDELSWHKALTEADGILDETIVTMGYAGATFDERIQHIDPRHFPFFDEALSAHKIAAYFEQDPNYRISREAAEKTFDIYRRVFEELGIV